MAYITLDQNELEPLFETILPCEFYCKRCFDTGIWLTPRNEVCECPQIIMGDKFHPLPNPASIIVRKAAERQKELKNYILGYEFELARILTHFTRQEPCKREKLDNFFYIDTNLNATDMERAVKKMISNLRQVWLLPVGSSKKEPYGQWIITDLEDYKKWFKSATKGPITQLSIIHKNARFNFPHFAEQMKLDFFEDVEVE